MALVCDDFQGRDIPKGSDDDSKVLHVGLESDCKVFKVMV